MIIEYPYLSSATYSYKQLGYEFIEVPWIVSHESHASTASPANGAFVTEDKGYLIGSAEQGFIEIMLDLQPNKKYAAISPCFRKNDNRDEFHQETFMKLELFSYDSDENNNYSVMIEDARNVFDHLGIPKVNLSYIQSLVDNSIDLNIGNLELGSYGDRFITKNETLYVINYGTGLALPRFTQGLNFYRQFIQKKTFVDTSAL